MKHKKYQLYDVYEDYGEIGKFDTLEEVQAEADAWLLDTDSECQLVVRQWDEELQTYRPLKEKSNEKI